MNGTLTTLANRLPAFVAAQMAWAVCSALWNLVGSIRLSQGLIGLGPTASLPAAVVLVVLAATLSFIWRRWRVAYVALSALVALGAAVTVYGAFTNSPDLWPSDFWRYGGAAMNTVGTLPSLAGIVAAIGWASATSNLV
jgi:hypothetical protein